MMLSMTRSDSLPYATIQRSVDGWPASGSSDFDVESIVMFAEETQDAGIVQNSMVVSGEPYPIHH
jgi:hypothetical protein